ncbi:hypothetical protein [Psychrobacillus sp. MER TA 171]|nr:hypothetical protein [Psychrobacillus sp. MER TA 171]
MPVQQSYCQSFKKSAGAYLCPDRQMGKSEEAAPQPPELLSI